MGNFKEDIVNVKAFVFDCDGVFTDGRIVMLPSGEMLRSFHAKDGFAVSLAIKRGYPIAVISGGKGEAMMLRFRKLGVTDIYLSCGNKLEALEDFRAKHALNYENIMFMGDDIPDVEPMLQCGLPVAPADAVPEVKNICRYISNVKGGDGCVRDVIEQVLKAQGNWAAIGCERDLFSL